ncbi:MULTISPECIES: phosphatase domain-containing protein [Altibacter]|uniref:App1 family protein n=1 Tax=Altibacter TaxID=1535231 RepID=UPI000557FBEF|nr:MULTISPECIES: phosphatase domain-containing protein [Altibacter]MCW9037159.1 DUF2183 domain-containing protein [Altibacter sp.]
MGWFKKDPLQIIVFQSYGTSSHLYVRGRALEDENIDLSKKGFFSLLKNSIKRFETDEVAHTKLRIKLPDDRVFYTTTDAKGYFKFSESIQGLTALCNEEHWLLIELAFENDHPGWVIKNNNRFPGEVLIPNSNIGFGVVSDIDDTIIHTGVASFLKLKLVFNTFFRNAESRSPLEGASQFYHLLHRGKDGASANPMFYASHSPWNLYRYLELFLKANNFPKGPVLLRNLPSPFARKDLSEKPQKQREILDILATYPAMKFILVGDSGEHDADIYIEIAKKFPDRILAIYLRSVKHKKKVLRVKSLFSDYKTTPALLLEDSTQAIEHARSHGFIQ